MDSTKDPQPEPVDSAKSLVQQLRAVTIFSDLPEDGLQWIASHLSVSAYKIGEAAVTEGEPADRLLVALAGEFHGRVEKGPDDGRKFIVRTGDVTGMLPYSRMKIFPSTLRAIVPGSMGSLRIELFDELLQRLPQLHTRFVGIISDRVRAKALNDQQLEKMAALGKLSAGVAHELNNPAAAARRAAENLKEAFHSLREASLRLDKSNLKPEQRIFLSEFENHWVSKEAAPLDALDRGDREEELADWLEQRNVDDAWRIAGDLASAGYESGTLEELASHFAGDEISDVLTRLNASHTISRLLSEIQSSTSRISELVMSIKEYSYMDRMPQQEIDVHDGIESTLVMLGHKLRAGVRVVRDYDRSTPKIPAYGSELNQVWTNLIDNAVDAMNGTGEIMIRTANEGDRVLVEVRDNGPGIPSEIKNRVFEPFFTTKPVGKGTGLGLDTVYRTVEKHRGEIMLESKPGETRFMVRLPVGSVGKRAE